MPRHYNRVSRNEHIRADAHKRITRTPVPVIIMALPFVAIGHILRWAWRHRPGNSTSA
ncbi:MAG: hypothetical protein HOF01_09890 [Chloroflexi bacterium]|nr:hypothetical protein [Chloroflexota bacterium]